MRADAVIVGGGPSGLLAAQRLARRGYSPQLYDLNPKIGIPNHCAGLISKKGLDRIGVEADPSFIQHEVKGGRIYSPKGEYLEIRDKKTRAYAIDRTIFDRHLAEIAEDSGVVIHKNSMVKELLRENGIFQGVRLSQQNVNTNIVLDAEGSNRLLLRKAGLYKKNKGMLSGVNIVISGVELEPNIVEVWFNDEFAPGFFAWVIPLNDSCARCGLASRGSHALSRLRKFVYNRFGKVETEPPRGGVVLTGGPISRTYYHGLIIVGDAAGHVKPTTGGGVILGGICALIAGDVASKAIDVGDFSSNYLSRYETYWKNELDRDFQSMLLLRKLMNRIDNKLMDEITHTVLNEGLETIIQGYVEEGDMDFQASVIKKTIMNPRILSLGLKFFGRLALNELMGLVNL